MSRLPLPGYDKVLRRALGVGVAGIVLSAIAWTTQSEQFYRAWLIGWFFWFSVAAGSLGLFMVYRLTGGTWGESVERILLAAGSTFEALAALFVPLFFGLGKLYPWTHHGALEAEEKLRHKHAYLNLPFWCLRTLGYFAAWSILSRTLARTDHEGTRRLSAGGLILLFLTVTFASIDWLMSLEPLWYSTVYGMLILATQGISAMAFALLALHPLQKVQGWDPPLTEKALKDQGSLLLTTCAVWTYLAFVQWLIAWIGNVPETVTWYVARAGHGWQVMAWAVVIGQFAIPFNLLLFQAFKTRTRNLAALGLILLIFRALDTYWLIAPAFHPESSSFNWMVLPALAGIGGLWLACFLRQLRTIRPASVANPFTPRLGELLNHA